MARYTVRRLLQSLVTILIVMTIVFLLLRLLPTDYYFTEEQLIKLTDQQKADQLQAAGLLDNIFVQLFRKYSQLIRLDFGTSRRIQNGVPVIKVIGGKFAISMRLGVTALGISLGIGVVLGILQARFKDGIIDAIGTIYTVIVNAVPALVSYSLVLVIGTRLFGLPSLYSSRNPGPSIILPIVSLSLASIAGYALWTRRYMVDELNKDYIKLAKVKGLSTRRIMVTHVLRNAFVPLAQYLPYSFLLTIGGSLLVERFYSIPGMGPLLTDAISRYDTTLVETLVMFYAALGIMGVFLGDVLMMIIDPRITIGQKGGSR